MYKQPASSFNYEPMDVEIDLYLVVNPFDAKVTREYILEIFAQINLCEFLALRCKRGTISHLHLYIRTWALGTDNFELLC
jgi:hypothetical protein